MTYSDPQRFYIAQLILYIGTFVIVVVTLIAKQSARGIRGAMASTRSVTGRRL